MMNWLMDLMLKKVLEAADGLYQRAVAKGNRLHTFAGVAGGGAIVAVLNYLEQTMGCDLSQVKLVALYPVLQGWAATGARFSFPATSPGDGASVKETR